MKYTRFGLMAAAALLALPAVVSAQEEGAAAAEGAEGEAAEGEAAEGEGAPKGEEEFDDSEFEGGEGAEGMSDICKIDPAACPTIDMAKEAQKKLPENIKAVQQRFIIKKHRFELQPFWGFTLNDQFVSHHAPGLAANFYITEAMAVGINGQYYEPFNGDSDFNAQVRRAARVGIPLTEYQWSAAANFTYVPASGKFSGFQNFIFHYDVYVLGGVGVVSTRPIPVMDPDYRNFEFVPKVAFNAGVGIKIFMNRWFAAVLEVRDYIFIDELENTAVPATAAERQDPNNWMGESSLTNNVQAQLGVSVFIPFSFEYRLPKAGADTTGGAAK